MLEIQSCYFHFPFCDHLCNYCDFYKAKLTASISQIEEYHHYLRRTWNNHEKLILENGFMWGKLKTLYFGGGTPSLWGCQGAKFFEQDILNKWFTLDSECEWTMEIDPATWSEEGLLAWQKLGVNRFSVGAQAYSSRVLKLLDRGHQIQDIDLLLNRLKGTNFSIDLMIGAPVKNRKIIEEIDLLLGFDPKHFSVYILKTRGNYPLKEELPEDDEVAQEYLAVCEYLEEKGFLQYEVSNFAKPGFFSTHNRKYWEGASVAALGPVATGYLAMNSSKALRYQWKPKSGEVFTEHLQEKELLIEQAYLCLRQKKPFSQADFPQVPSFEKIAKRWLKHGYCRYFEDHYVMTSKGFLLLDTLVLEVM